MTYVKQAFKRAPVSTKRRRAFILTALDKNRRTSNPVQATLANTGMSWQRIQEETPTLKALYEYLATPIGAMESVEAAETPEAECTQAPVLPAG